MVSAKTRRVEKLRHLYESAVKDKTPHRFFEDTRELFCDNATDLKDFSLREMAIQFIPDGHEFVSNHCAPSSEGGVQLMEAADSVDTGAFSNIIGQYSYSAVLKGYQKPEFVGDKLCEVIPTSFNGERIPGVGRIGDDVEVVNENDAYPNATFGEEWIDTPETIKRGLILDITMEAVFFDRTAQVLTRAGELGQAIQMNREKRILDVVCGIATVYRRNGAAAEATYQADNTVTSTALVDWQSVNAAEQKLVAITDPTTGEPVMITANCMWGPKDLDMTARRIINATMTRQGTNSGNTQTYANDNLLAQSFDWVSGPYVKQRTSSASTWFYGDPKQAFAYMQNYPLKVTKAAENNEAMFRRDVIASFKASERGAAAVRDRRYAVKVTA